MNGLLVDGKLNVRAIVHRDRDFMTAEEMTRWANRYSTNGVFPWVTAFSDVEAYFCQPDYVASLYGIQLEEAEQWCKAAAENVQRAHETFLEKRKSIVRALWPNGGSPDAEKMLEEAGGKSPQTVKGKRLLAALKTIAKANRKDYKLIDCFTIPPGFVIAPDLRAVIESATAVQPRPVDL